MTVEPGSFGKHAARSATYYTVSDHSYFLGTVAMINSLRLTGNAGEIVVLDRGLTGEQRRTLGSHCSIVRFEDARRTDIEQHPFLVKPYPHLFGAHGNIVIIDSDMIVTQRFDSILDRIASGRICAIEDPTLPKRWFAIWETELELRAPLRRQTYANAGFIAFSTERWPDFLARWWDLCRIILPRWVDDPELPFHWLDQDALNAMLMSEIPEDALELMPKSRAPAFEDLRETRVADAGSLTSVLHDRPTLVLHNAGPIKPWDRRKWYRLQHNAYLELMPRVLSADDVPLRIRVEEVPVWLRAGTAPRVYRRSLTILSSAARRTVRGLPPLTRFIRARFRARRPGA